MATATLIALFKRRTDLGDELSKSECYAYREARGYSPLKRIKVPSDSTVDCHMLGLEGSMEWHRARRSVYFSDKSPLAGNERALLCQTTLDLEAVDAYGRATPLKTRLPQPLSPGCFGENLHLSGPDFDSGHICIGDEYHVLRGARDVDTKLRVQVASPRLPCSRVDKALGNTFGSRGIRAQCARTGQAGFFLRVLVPGTLRVGDRLVRTKHPHPAWSVRRVQRLLYSHPNTVTRYAMRGALREEWMGTQAELRELGHVKELAVCEYREEVLKLNVRSAI